MTAKTNFIENKLGRNGLVSEQEGTEEGGAMFDQSGCYIGRYNCPVKQVAQNRSPPRLSSCPRSRGTGVHGTYSSILATSLSWSVRGLGTVCLHAL